MDLKTPKRRILLAPKPLSEFEAAEFRHYVEALYIRPETKGSQLVEGVGITFGTRTIVRIKRDPKYVTREELTLLSEEYGRSPEELETLLRSRKVEIRG